jgi:hypothetical protein
MTHAPDIVGNMFRTEDHSQAEVTIMPLSLVMRFTESFTASTLPREDLIHDISHALYTPLLVYCFNNLHFSSLSLACDRVCRMNAKKGRVGLGPTSDISIHSDNYVDVSLIIHCI